MVVFMFQDFREKSNLLNNKIDKLIEILEKRNVNEIVDILGSRKEIIRRNILAGIFRGIGIGIGVTIITAILILTLRNLVALNIPIIGSYIADIVEIVEKSR